MHKDLFHFFGQTQDIAYGLGKKKVECDRLEGNWKESTSHSRWDDKVAAQQEMQKKWSQTADTLRISCMGQVCSDELAKSNSVESQSKCYLETVAGLVQHPKCSQVLSPRAQERVRDKGLSEGDGHSKAGPPELSELL